MAMRRVAVCLTAAAAALLTMRADADGTSGNSQCASAYEQAQVEKQAVHLRAARDRLLICSGSACPTWMQKECQVWLEDVDRATPTVVLTAAVEGEDRTQVQVELDGKPWLDSISARALPFEIGEHLITFRVPGYPPIEKRVVLSEGEKLKRIRVEFEHPKPKASTSAISGSSALGPSSAEPNSLPPNSARPVPLGVWLLGGVALASVGTSVALGMGANDEKSRLESQCAPRCDDADVDDLRGRYVVTNVVLGVGIAAAAGAAAWYFLRPSKFTGHRPVGSWVIPRVPTAGVVGFEF